MTPLGVFGCGQELVAAARQLRGNPSGRPQSLRKIAASLGERGYVTPSGRPLFGFRNRLDAPGKVAARSLSIRLFSPASR
jgi:hypothetical protein